MKKISNESVRKVIEKRFDMYPYQGNDEFEELKNKLKEKVNKALIKERNYETNTKS